MWCVYLISNGTRTYIGSTTDVKRRVRQHNGEIRGGARATSRTPGKWKLVCWISGFDGRSSACRWERIIKCRARGHNVRVSTMYAVSRGMCPIYRNRQKYYEVPAGLEIHYDT